jgi:hypothetical protein
MASRLNIIRKSSGVPSLALSPKAKVLECDVHTSTAEDWKWLKAFERKRGKPFSRRARLRQTALRPYVDKPLISACIRVKNSFFLIFVDPEIRSAIFWEERR